jgi:catechol 2,3-dioxygenase-like lactoylglutathione lyase family enzyme
MSTWDKDIGVIELLCEDLAAGRAFYTDVFGLKPEMEDETSVAFVFGQMLVILNDLPSGQELIEPVPVAPPKAAEIPPRWHRHLPETCRSQQEGAS